MPRGVALAIELGIDFCLVANGRIERLEMLKAPHRPKRCPWCNSDSVAQTIHEINAHTPAVQQGLTTAIPDGHSPKTGIRADTQ